MPEYTKQDYMSGSAPYAELYELRANAFEHQQRLELLAADATGKGFRGFKKMYSEYTRARASTALTIYADSVTQFTDQPLELDTGAWRADDLGVTLRDGYADVVACVHPILPVSRLVNVDTGSEKLELAYRKGKQWRRLIVDKRTIASASNIVALADSGIAVTSESAKYLVKYLHDVENFNYDVIPEQPSVGRLGYIDGEGFSPYVDGLVFDGDAAFRHMFQSVRACGSPDRWQETIRTVRKQSTAAKIVVAASFASALVHPLGGLPFFVHLWGAESGAGKTVALMAAASVWADPQIGRYIQTFNSTTVGHERLATFLNSLPIIIDELQLAKDARGKLAFDVYKLAEGVGKTRGNRSGGIDLTPTWQCCILTSGESPITGGNAGAGAKNRVLELECTGERKIIENGHAVALALKQHYGHAGRRFVELLSRSGAIDTARTLFKAAFDVLSQNDTTEKQAMAAAIVIAADFLAAPEIIGDEPLTVEEIASFLQTNREVDVNERAYAWLCDWVASNAGMFHDNDFAESRSIFGKLMPQRSEAAIIRSVFNQAVEDAGYSPSALLSWLRRRGLIRLRSSQHRAFTVPIRINGMIAECVVVSLTCEPIGGGT